VLSCGVVTLAKKEANMIQYRSDVVKFFKEAGFTVREKEEIKEGEIYFSNSGSWGRSGFKIERLLTDKEHWAQWQASMGQSGESIFGHSDEVEWFEIIQDGVKFWHSLTNCNVGASYNPWMIFKTKKAMEAYELIQEISYERDYLDDMFECYDYNEA
jgi:hypothetical protein